jgi:chromosomal replication initiation ATPase DnaA
MSSPGPGQFALPLRTDQAGLPSGLLVGNGNKSAVEALRQPSAWPYGTAVLTGPARCGKSVLGQWAAAQAREHGTCNVIDDADSIAEDVLFHRWNHAQEAREYVLFIANARPWRIALPDLRSRISAALHLEVGPPDDEMVEALLLLHGERRGLALGPDAARYIAPRITRDYAAIERVVAAIDRLSLERKVRPSPSVWRDALEAIQGPEQASLL